MNNSPANPLRSIRRYQLAGFMVTALFVGGVGTWAATTEIAGAIIASGQLVVDSNVKNLKTGEIARGVASHFAMVGWFDKAKASAGQEKEFLQAVKQVARKGVNSIKDYYNKELGGRLKPFAAAKERGDYFRNIATSLAKPITSLAGQMALCWRTLPEVGE